MREKLLAYWSALTVLLSWLVRAVYFLFACISAVGLAASLYMNGLAMRGVAFGQNQLFWNLMCGIFVCGFLESVLGCQFLASGAEVCWFRFLFGQFPGWVKWVYYSIVWYCMLCYFFWFALAIFGIKFVWFPPAFFETEVSYIWIMAYSNFLLVYSAWFKSGGLRLADKKED